MVADVVRGAVPLELLQGVPVGHGDLLLPGQEDVDVQIGVVGLEEPLLRGDGVVIKAVEVHVVPVDVVAPGVEGGQVGGHEKAQGGVQIGGQAQVGLQVAAVKVQHTKTPHIGLAKGAPGATRTSPW